MGATGPGRGRVTAGPGTTIRDRDYRPGLDASRMPRSTVPALGGPRTARGRSAMIEDPSEEPVFPDMRDSSYWPELPDPRRARNLKKGGAVKKAAPKKSKSKKK